MAEEQAVKTSSVSKKYLLTNIQVSIKWQNLDTKIKRRVKVKKLMWDLGHIAVDSINQYVPKDTGALREKGYNLATSNSKIKPWFKLTYRNTTQLPYVMYQYNGKVYGPNYPKFKTTMKITDISLPVAVFKHEHIGWTSPKGKGSKHETWRHFARRKRWVKLRNGKTITINGYTTTPRKIQPGWVEYASKHSHEFGGYAEPMRRLIEETFRNAINGK